MRFLHWQSACDSLQPGQKDYLGQADNDNASKIRVDAPIFNTQKAIDRCFKKFNETVKTASARLCCILNHRFGNILTLIDMTLDTFRSQASCFQSVSSCSCFQGLEPRHVFSQWLSCSCLEPRVFSQGRAAAAFGGLEPCVFCSCFQRSRAAVSVEQGLVRFVP